MAGKSTPVKKTVKASMPKATEEVFKLPVMTRKETEGLLKSCRICRMALHDRPHPYLICLDYAYKGGKMYFHFADYGRKMGLFIKDPNVSVEVDRYNKDVTDYMNATLMGRLVMVTDAAEKKKAAKALVEAIEPKAGKKKVAARHGYKKLDVETLSSPRSVLLRLDVKVCIALKSPP
jgi:nitroimidazol reductase NimA-like FMN-containing flavoprotein (pyridoxamine 5'-phosphate oxidase superfamily)